MRITVKEIVEKLDLEVFSGAEGLGAGVTGGYASDLLSDAMGFAKEGQLWITLQTHRNVIGVASHRDLAAVILVKGLVPDEDTLAASESEGIPILGSDMQAFELSGKLYEILRR